MNRKAVIFGIKGTILSDKEKIFLKKHKPWGVILFSRNIENIFQLKYLISNIRNCLKDDKYPILIDQEGGQVSRLNKILDLRKFSQAYFGKLYTKNKIFFYKAYEDYVNKISKIFKFVGININTVPVLDVKRLKSHSVIGSRSFSKNSKIVSEMGSLCIKLFEKNKIGTVMKHIPGHGLATVDSHKKKPIINASQKKLKNIDFKPFKACKSFFAMTAHIVYSAYDTKFCATQSKIVIKKVIRRYIGFSGILISDDISMKALKFGLKNNAFKASKAGCNLILHCNGSIREMKEVVKKVPKIDKFTQKKTSHFYKFLG